MKNKNQIKKELHSNKHSYKPIKFVYYENQKDTFLKLLTYLAQNNKKKILVLGRNRKDIYSLLTPSITFQNNRYYYKNIEFQYMTVHQSKGLEEECVILIHLENSIMGFPNKLEEDNIFRLLQSSETFAYEEERRLFYVALTRTKNENYLLIPTENESIFVKELKRDFSEKIENISIK